MAVKGQKPIVKWGKKVRRWTNQAIARHSLVGDPHVFAPGTFPWAMDLEANWRIIRQEAEAVLAERASIPTLGEISPDHQRLTDDGKWQSFFIWGYGFRVPENCARCPETARLVEAIPGLKTALFSIHAPGLHIPRHKGVTKGMITCHLPLIVPPQPGACRMAVADELYHWEEGRTLAFDDTYPHEVWNDSPEDRVILLLQVDRPLALPGRVISSAFLTAVRWSPFVQDARRNMRRWDAARR